MGREIANGKIENGIVSVATIPAGIYLLEIIQDGKVTSKRFIKE